MERDHPAVHMTQRRNRRREVVRAGHSARQRGVALVVVLWVIVLLTIIVSSFAFSVRSHIQDAGSQVALAKARALADAGVNRAIYELAKPGTDDARWKAQGQTYSFELDGGTVSVRIINEAAFIDLNMAPENLLIGLFESVGVEAGQAQALGDAVEDWRDPDDLPKLSGAERDQYQAAGLKQVPANADFRSVDELKEVYGMTPEIFSKVAGSLTVYSKVAGVDSTVASRAVLMAIPDIKAEAVDAYLASRRDMLDSGMAPTPLPEASGYDAGTSGSVYNIESKAALADGTVYTTQAIIRLTADMKHPYIVFEWREARSSRPVDQ